MPKRHLLTRFVKDLKEFSLKYVDYCHYTVPINQANPNGFVFPGEYIGQYGVYDAVKHVYSTNDKLRPLLHEDYLLTNKRYFASEMETAVEQIRRKFRDAQGIDQNAYSIFLAPGNEKKEVEFTMENLRRGVKEFLLKYSAPTSFSPKALPLNDNFVTIISLHEGSEGAAWVREYLSKNEWTGKLVIVTNENNQHFDAMAASDFGFVHDGQMVSSANALNLPVNCIFDMRMHQQFYQNYFNRWWNDMNLIADRDVNQELIGGQAWWGKYCDTLAENYVNPQARQQSIARLRHFVEEGMSYKPIDRTQVRTRDLLIDGQAHDQFYDPFVLAARNMWADISQYEGLGNSDLGVDGLKVSIPRL